MLNIEQAVYGLVGENVFRVFIYTGMLFWTIVMVAGLWVVFAWIFGKVKN